MLSHVTLLLSALLVTAEGFIVMETLKVFPVLAKTDPSQVLSLSQLVESFTVLYVCLYFLLINRC